ncbi:MAG: hypothetical protein GWP61_20250 [Chloroflexi bacterium]|jgi:Tol biopolymer transport system component|nr:hypothetical protein [Chloroflexota bacterium]
MGMLLSAGGKNFAALTDSAGYQTHASPDWSRVGSRIVFAADLDENHNIYIMDSDGSSVQQLTFEETDGREPLRSTDHDVKESEPGWKP